MKRFLLLFLILSAFSAQAATITRGKTFTDTETVTASKLHQLVDSATISGISASDLSDGIISNAKLGANAVTTEKITDGTIATADLADYSLTTAKYSTNSVTGAALITNLEHRAQTYLIFTNAGTRLNFTNATLAFGSGQISGSAIASGTFVTNSGITTRTTYLSADVASATAYANILKVTNTTLGATRIITANALFSDDDVSTAEATAFCRLLEVAFPGQGTTNVIASAGSGSGTGFFFDQSFCMTTSRPATTTNIYIIQGMDNAGATGAKWRTSGASVGSGTPAFSNAIAITELNLP